MKWVAESARADANNKEGRDSRLLSIKLCPLNYVLPLLYGGCNSGPYAPDNYYIVFFYSLVYKCININCLLTLIVKFKNFLLFQKIGFLKLNAIKIY